MAGPFDLQITSPNLFRKQRDWCWKPEARRFFFPGRSRQKSIQKIAQQFVQLTGGIDLGKPEGYVKRKVAGWIKRYYAAETDTIESMNAVAE